MVGWNPTAITYESIVFSISEAQLGKLEERLVEGYHARIAAHCQTRFPIMVQRISSEDLNNAVTDGISRASQLGFQRHGGTRLVVELSLLFGCGFIDDPLHPWAKRALDVPDVVLEPRRSRKLYEAAQDYVARLLKGSTRSPDDLAGSVHAFLATSDFGLETKSWAVDLEALLRSRFPEQISVASPSAYQKLIADIAGKAKSLGVSDLNDAARCAALQISFGHRWFEDPALPQLRKALENEGMAAAGTAARLLLPNKKNM